LETEFDDNGNVVHSTSAKTLFLPEQHRYDFRRADGNPVDKRESRKTNTLYNHRRTFLKALDAFVAPVFGPPGSLDGEYPLSLSAEFKMFLVNLWDMTVMGEFSPSLRLSAKIVVLGYTLWRTLHPETEHHLDFHFSFHKVSYLVLDDGRADLVHEYPTFCIPPVLVNKIQYHPNTRAYYASVDVKTIVQCTMFAKVVTAPLRIYGKEIEYLVTKHDSTHLTIMPTNFGKSRVDIGIAVTTCFKDPAHSSVSPMLWYKGVQCKPATTKIKTCTTTGRTSTCVVFLVEGFSTVHPGLDVQLPKIHSKHTLTVPHVLETRGAHRSKTSIKFVGVPLVVHARDQQFNTYVPPSKPKVDQVDQRTTKAQNRAPKRKPNVFDVKEVKEEPLKIAQVVAVFPSPRTKPNAFGVLGAEDVKVEPNIAQAVVIQISPCPKPNALGGLGGFDSTAETTKKKKRVEEANSVEDSDSDSDMDPF
jgi:hypothetical protein